MEYISKQYFRLSADIDSYKRVEFFKRPFSEYLCVAFGAIVLGVGCLVSRRVRARYL